MSITASKITSRRFSRLREWANLVIFAGSAQIMVQAIGFVCGIIVIRLLSVDEYAVFTLANTMLGTMTLLADSGISAGVMSQGGKVWQNRRDLGSVLTTGMSLRKKFALYSVVIAVPVFFYLLRKHETSILMSVLVIISTMPAFLSTLSGKLLEIGPKLHQDIPRLQQVGIASSCLRLIVTSVLLLVFPFANSAILASGIAQLFANWRMRFLIRHYADLSQGENIYVRAEILSMVQRAIPNAIYFCISGSASIWLISFFGSTESMAELGALARLSILLAPLSICLDLLVMPRFARLKCSNRALLQKFFKIQVGLFCISAMLFLTACFFSGSVLWILGKNYAGLSNEMILMVLGNCLSLIANCSYQLIACRGMVVKPTLSIFCNVIAQLSFMCLFDVKSTYGVLGIAACVSAIQTLFYYGCFIRYFRSPSPKSDETFSQ